MNYIYEYITNFTDERTTLNMLSVNKKFYDEKILLRVMNKKYPLLYKIKKSEKCSFLSWREFYVDFTFFKKTNVKFYCFIFVLRKSTICIYPFFLASSIISEVTGYPLPTKYFTTGKLKEFTATFIR